MCYGLTLKVYAINYIGAKKGKMEYSEKNRTNDMHLEGKKVEKAYSYQNIDNEKIT